MSVGGFFLVLEGPEGAGKSTLARGLAGRLEAEGTPAVAVREPGGTPVAEAARAIVLEQHDEVTPAAELFLVLAARADLVARVIRPALDAGRFVLCDRYDLSTLAYQVAGRGLDEGLVRAANRLATGGLQPHLTLVLDIPPALGRARQLSSGKRRDRLDREAETFHERVARAYLSASGPGVLHLDATVAPPALLEAAWTAVAAARGGPRVRNLP